LTYSSATETGKNKKQTWKQSMQAFSRTLMDLYHLAENAPLDDFPPEVLRLLQPWINFDGAVFGVGETYTDQHTNLQVVQAHVHNRSQSMLDDYAQVSAHDPITGAFLNGLSAPLAVDCKVIYEQKKLDALEQFARKHDLRNLMLYGDHPTADHPGRWMVLYRGTDKAFSAEEADCLHAAWFHVSRAIDISHAKLLDQLDTSRAQRASALVNMRGVVEAADPHFFTLLQREWPGHEGKTLPASLKASMAAGFVYRGQQIEIAMKQQDAYFVCLARAATSIANLTPSELAVARRFAAGLSAKEIARELGVSPNTVRSQLTTLYAKLDVHDKAALAQLLITHP
jgi:DNA-binding CsgD family transcriptional regulator